MISRFSAALVSARHLLLLLLLTLPAWAPLTRPGLPATLAGPLPVLNLYAFERGQAPAVGSTADGWRSDGPWTYAVAQLPRWLGADGVTAMKWSATLALLALAVGVYGWAGRVAGRSAGVVAALLVTLAGPVLSTPDVAGPGAPPGAPAGVTLAGRGLARTGGRGTRRAGPGPVYVDGKRAGALLSRVVRSGGTVRVGDTLLCVECVPHGLAGRSHGMVAESDLAWAIRNALAGLAAVQTSVR